MTKKLRMTLLGMSSVAAMAAPVALAVSCGGDSAGGVTKAMGIDLTLSKPAKVWMVADGGSVQDKSFNEGALAGVAQYGNANNVTYNYVQPEPANLAGAYSSAMNGGAEMMVGAGFMHGDNDYTPGTPTIPAEYGFASKALANNPEKWFMAVDVDFSQNTNTHLAGVTYDTQKNGFWAGVFTAKYLNEHRGEIQTPEEFDVAMYGGGAFPSVTSWMVGFEKGVRFANANHVGYTGTGTEAWKDVYVLPAKMTTDSFASPSTQAADLTKQFVKDGADVIFPVAGPQIKDTLKATAGTKVKVIGVDGDQYSIYKDPRIIGSALKGLQKDVVEGLTAFYDTTDTNHQKFIANYHTTPKNGTINFVAGTDGAKWEETQATEFLGVTSITYPTYTELPLGLKLQGNTTVVDSSAQKQK